MSQTSTAAGPSTAAPPPPPPVSLIPIDVLHGFVDLLSQPHARETIIGTAAVNALLTAELVGQVTRIADWHKRAGTYLLGPEVVAGLALAVNPGAVPAASGGTTATGTALAMQAHSVSGAAPGTLTPFLADINTVVQTQLTLRDTLIAGLRSDLTTAQSAIADLKTEHATMMAHVAGLRTDLTTARSAIADLKTEHATMTAQVAGVQTKVDGQIDLTTKQGAALAQMGDDVTGLKSAHDELTHQTSALRTDVASARAQIEPLTGRVEQMVFDLARQDVAIREIARDAAAPTEVMLMERLDPEPPEPPEDTPPEDTGENHPRGRRPGHKR